MAAVVKLYGTLKKSLQNIGKLETAAYLAAGYAVETVEVCYVVVSSTSLQREALAPISSLLSSSVVDNDLSAASRLPQPADEAAVQRAVAAVRGAASPTVVLRGGTYYMSGGGVALTASARAVATRVAALERMVANVHSMAHDIQCVLTMDGAALDRVADDMRVAEVAVFNGQECLSAVVVPAFIILRILSYRRGA